jgi:hypothetical protein
MTAYRNKIKRESSRISFLRLNYFCKTQSIIGIAFKTNNMKIALFSAFAVLVFSGCTKTYPTVTNTVIDSVNQVYSALYTVAANQWVQGTDPDGTVFYSTTLTIAELTEQIDLNGGVLAYLSFDDPTSTNPTYEAMPEVFNGVAYGVIHSTGSITVDLRGADGSSLTSAISAPTLIKVVLLDAKPLGN